jgi:hypothetical protein
VGTAISNAAFNPTEYRGLIAFQQPYEIPTTSYILPHCDARPTMYRFATDAPLTSMSSVPVCENSRIDEGN